MGVLEIISIIAGIAAILSFIYVIIIGPESLPNWLKTRRKAKLKIGARSESVAYEFDTERPARENRKTYDETLRKRIRLFFDGKAAIPDSFSKMLTAQGFLTSPAVEPPRGSIFVDCICTALTKEGKTILILPSGESSPDKEGIGRTSIVLKLLNLAIDTGKIMGLSSDEITHLANIQPNPKLKSSYSIQVADMAYIGVSGGKLSIIPSNGERMSFVWDLARYIYRATTIGYKTGEHRTVNGRQKLLAIFNKIDLEFIDHLYGPSENLTEVNEVIILKRTISASPVDPKWERLSRVEVMEHLRKAILVSTEHGSEFWRRNVNATTEQVNKILEATDFNDLPPVSQITYSNPDAAIPDFVFDDIVERIEGKDNPPTRNQMEEIRVILGVNLHNYELAKGLLDTNEARLVVTSGEKTFTSMGFWNALSKVNRPLTLKMLLLNPDSAFVTKRQEEAYQDKDPGFLKKEIEENIETIKRLSKILTEKNRNLHIECLLYDLDTSFRMTFINEDRLLVTSYKKDKRTGKTTIFYEINHNLTGLYLGFEQEYFNLEQKATPVFSY